MKALVQIKEIQAGQVVESGPNVASMQFEYVLLDTDGSVVEVAGQLENGWFQVIDYSDTPASMRTKIASYVRTALSQPTITVVFITDSIGLL